MKYLTLFAIVMLLVACGKKSGNESQNMAAFAKDTSFQAAHDAPQPIHLQPRGEIVTFGTPDGKTGSAYALSPKVRSKKFLLVIHEWWGLNDHIWQTAENLFDSLGDATVLALDMYDGKSATTPTEAGKLMQAMSKERGEAVVKGALAYASKDAQIATIGWCFGGGWSLQASILAEAQAKACVMYYGMPVQNAKELAPLQAPVLFVLAKRDRWITPEVGEKFEALAKATGKQLTIRQFDADHAFANPSNPNFDATAAREANALALEFLRTHFR